MKLNYISGILIFVFMFISSLALAAGVGWLSDAPIRYFSDKDTELMKNAVQKALGNNDDGVKLEWENAETGAKGSITPVDKKIIDGLSCRDAEVFNSAGGRIANSVFTFCRQEDGEWKLANK